MRNDPVSPTAATLVIRKRIPASIDKVFAAWTEPDHLKHWWGPPEGHCPEAEIDLRIGGTYRIANRMPDGRTIWICGTFDVIEPPTRLTYSWQLDASRMPPEQVTVQFRPLDGETEVVVTHERIVDMDAYRSHTAGWESCLQDLLRYLSERPIRG